MMDGNVLHRHRRLGRTQSKRFKMGLSVSKQGDYRIPALSEKAVIEETEKKDILITNQALAEAL